MVKHAKKQWQTMQQKQEQKTSDYNTGRHTAADDEVVSQCPGTVPVLFQVPQGKPVANFHRFNW